MWRMDFKRMKYMRSQQKNKILISCCMAMSDKAVCRVTEVRLGIILHFSFQFSNLRKRIVLSADSLSLLLVTATRRRRYGWNTVKWCWYGNTEVFAETPIPTPLWPRPWTLIWVTSSCCVILNYLIT